MNKKELKDGTTSDGPGMSEEDESRINDDAKDVNVRIVEFQEQAAPQRQQQQPQPIIQWERFLPVRSLKVLLVENDFSTRQLVSALLRNCSYEVLPAANGLEAWKILEDITCHVDLILTEVAMPCLSGIALLCKIMNHKTYKSIPVIMMSSNDSMGLAFKCLSKGAVDFLVKPIRKNELKNLWQHVWRKCHSSSGSGSESGTRTQKSRRSKIVEGSDNNTSSSDDEENGSIGLHVIDGSDNGSGTQCSWSKRAVEVESPQQMSSWDPIADPPDSTCAQVIHPMPEAVSNCAHKTTAKKHIIDSDLDMGKDLEIGVSNDPELWVEDTTKKVLCGVSGINKSKVFEAGSYREAENKEKGKQVANTETAIRELRNKASDSVCIFSSKTNIKIGVTFENPTDPSKSIEDMPTHENKEIPFVELGFRRQRDLGDTRTNSRDQNVLRHSDLSAFTRYNTASTANQASTGNVGSCSPLDNSSNAAKAESLHNQQSNSSGTPNQGSNGSSNNNDVGSTTNNAFTQLEEASNKPMLKSAVSIHSSSPFELVECGHSSVLHYKIPDKTNSSTINSVLGHAKAVNQQVQVQHHHHHYHHHHHHIHSIHQQQKLPHQDNLSLRNNSETAPHCESSNLVSAPVEGNAANYGSASGSNYGSNGQNGSSGQNGSCAGVIAEVTNITSDNCVAGKSGGGSGSGNAHQSEMDQNKYSQREAALRKFQKKRKERCFEKRVRYHSRKKLAEQRPRVRGQFVRQSAKENDKDTDC